MVEGSGVKELRVAWVTESTVDFRIDRVKGTAQVSRKIIDCSC